MDIIIANDTYGDTRTNELKKIYLSPVGIRSAIYAPVIIGKQLAGVFCMEDTKPRKWEFEEQTFAVALSEIIGKHIEQDEREKVKKAFSRSVKRFRKESDRKLVEKEKYYRTLIEESGEAIVVRNKEGVIVYVSPSVQWVFGLKEEDILGQPGFKLVHEDQLEQSKKDWNYIINNPGKSIRVDQKVMLPDGRIRFIEGTSRNLLNIDPIYGVVSNFRDVTKKKNAESALMESQVRLESIITSALDAIISVDSSMNVVLFNPAAEKMFLADASAVFGNAFGKLLPGEADDEKKARTFLEEAMMVHRGKSLLMGRRTDGSEFPMDVSAGKQLIEEEEFYTFIIRDITYEIELNEKNEALVSELQQKVHEQEKTLRLFSRYVPESVIKHALDTSEDSIFEGQTRYVTVLFCDIRGFTRMSEEMKPREVVKFLNNYYGTMTEIIKQYNGTVTQFVGDEIFTTFGAPLDTPDREKNAVFCALAMMKKVKTLSKLAGREISIGIGIHSGEVIAGNIGSEDRIDYAITGDTVNTGKRIETLTKNDPDKILISDSVYGKVSSLVKVKAWEPVLLKGKREKLNVYEVLGVA